MTSVTYNYNFPRDILMAGQHVVETRQGEFYIFMGECLSANYSSIPFGEYDLHLDSSKGSKHDIIRIWRFGNSPLGQVKAWTIKEPIWEREVE